MSLNIYNTPRLSSITSVIEENIVSQILYCQSHDNGIIVLRGKIEFDDKRGRAFSAKLKKMSYFCEKTLGK